MRGGHPGDAPTAGQLRAGVEAFDHRGAATVSGQGEIDRQRVVGLESRIIHHRLDDVLHVVDGGVGRFRTQFTGAHQDEFA